MKVDEDREYIAGLEKGLAIVEAFADKQRAVTVAEAAEFANVSRASARRCLRTLEQLGYAEHDGKHFRLASRALRLGHAYLASTPLVRIAQPIIEAASDRTRRSTSVAVLDANRVAIVARSYVQRSLSTGLGVGSWLPAYCSANGRILLSGLPDSRAEALLRNTARTKLTPRTIISIPEIMGEIRAIRARGYATNDEEVELGLWTMAVPIRDRSGAIVASLSMSCIGSSADRKQLVKLLPDLQATGIRLSSML
ncbi:MAG TPA: IclR family transcriptional regulator C-terminal domain-containing protein [Pseudolabrys sp.]|nr:IclR family transcriptional regulator C-terminal domain-containing protein [Pseudolabrys sp.]